MDKKRKRDGRKVEKMRRLLKKSEQRLERDKVSKIMKEEGKEMRLNNGDEKYRSGKEK